MFIYTWYSFIPPGLIAIWLGGFFLVVGVSTTFELQVYCDLDGVLADFNKGCLELFPEGGAIAQKIPTHLVPGRNRVLEIQNHRSNRSDISMGSRWKWRAMFVPFFWQLFDFLWVPGSMLSCFSAFLLCAFPALPASLLFMLLCFTCFFSLLLLCFSAFVLLGLSTLLFYVLFFSHVFVLLYFLLLCFSAPHLYCLFLFLSSCFITFYDHLFCILNETLKTLGETQRNPDKNSW